MTRLLLSLTFVFLLAGCAGGGASVHHNLPDGSTQVDNFSSTAGEGLAPSATAVTTYRCPKGGRDCEVLNSAVVGGNSVLDQVGDIVAPIASSALIGVSFPKPAGDSNVVNSSADGGNATNTNTNTANGGAGGVGNGGAGGNATNTNTITNTNGAAAPGGGPL